jgi:predicted acyltransferase
MLIFLKLKNAAQISAAAFLLLIISSAGFHIYAPENPFDEMQNISNAVDKIFPGVNHIYTATHDPEGLYGTFASAASMLFGILAGKFLLKNELWKMILYGTGILILGYGWSFFDIAAKKIWTAPYALLNAGGDMIFLALLVILFKSLPRLKKIFRPIEALGKNPFFFFVAANVSTILLCSIKIFDTPLWILIYQKTFQGFISVEFGTLIFCVAWCLLWIIPAEIFNRRGIILKI